MPGKVTLFKLPASQVVQTCCINWNATLLMRTIDAFVDVAAAATAAGDNSGAATAPAAADSGGRGKVPAAQEVSAGAAAQQPSAFRRPVKGQEIVSVLQLARRMC